MEMNCEEFATAGLDLGSAEVDSQLQKTAREHLRECAHCAVLHENWLALREDLRVLGAETAAAEAPSRVEMRLLQEFRTKHKTFRSQRTAVFVGWGLAAAASLFFVITWANWKAEHNRIATQQTAKTVESASVQTATTHPTTATSEPNEVLMASNDSDGFTWLPDSMPAGPEGSTVVRVQMQRAALGAFGLTVNEEHAGDLIQVDVLVGDDGMPQAVRLPQSATTSN
jgi:anti-sigma factor RsiW